MRLFSLTGATAVDDGGQHYEPDPEDGGFDFPPELGQRLHRTAVRGKPQWETDEERQDREAAEALAHQRDPAALYAVVSKLVQAAEGTPPPAKTTTAPRTRAGSGAKAGK